MLLNNIPAVSECLVEARHLLVTMAESCRSHKLVPLPQSLLSNAVAALNQVAKSSCSFFFCGDFVSLGLQAIVMHIPRGDRTHLSAEGIADGFPSQSLVF